MQDVITELANNSPFSEKELHRATSNYAAQGLLAEKLTAVFFQSKKTVESLSEYLGSSVKEATDIANGEQDLTLSELRQFANFLNVTIHYTVDITPQDAS